MGSEKGLTMFELVFGICIGFTLLCAGVGAVHMFGLSGSDGPVVSAEPTTTTARAPKMTSEAPEYRKIVKSQIVAVECAEFDCGEALVAFEREYRDCHVVPIGPFNVDGQTVQYYFLVEGGRR